MAFDFIFSGPPKLNVPVSGDTFPVTGYDIINNVMYVSTTTSGWVAVGDGGGTIDATQLQGRTISAAAPTNSQVLTWNATTNDWEPAASSSIASLQLPTAGLASPSPVYSPNEAPSTINPALYVQDVNGAWHEQAGMDTSSTIPNQPNGVLTFFRKLFVRDNRALTQWGKNAMLALFHVAGNQTDPNNQDRALCINMFQPAGTISNFSIAGNVVTLHLTLIDANAPFLENMSVVPSGLATGTYLNGQILTVISQTGAGGTGLQTVTAAFTHADVGSTSDTGTLSLNCQANEGLQVELDLNGAPVGFAGPDSELTALSVQMSDSRTGGNAPNLGSNCIRSQYFLSGVVVTDGNSLANIRCITSDEGLSDGGEQQINGILLQASSGGRAHFNYYAVYIQKPSGNGGAAFSNTNCGVYVEDFTGLGTTPHAIYVEGGPVYLGTGATTSDGTIRAGKFTVAALPTGAEGQTAYATNGRKVGEGAASGTGVPVYYSNGEWRVYSTDAQVQA